VRATAERFGIKVYKLGVERDHLHMVTRSYRHDDYAHFLRTLAGQIAQRIMKSARGNTKGKFWKLPPYSRIVEWGKAFRAVIVYALQNELEASGVIPYTPRKTKSPRRKPAPASTA
jgi:REP element-mobilizing transposase RayT